MHQLKQFFRYIVIQSMILLVFMQTCRADEFAGTGMPWESPLQKILDSLSGPVAKILGVIAIVLAGLGIAFGEVGSGMRKMFQIIFGLSIAFTATTLITTLFGVSGAGS